MQIQTSGHNLELTDAIKDAVKNKLSRLEQHYDFLMEVHVILAVEKNPRISDNQLAEATIHVTGGVLHTSAASENLYTSIDRLVDKIERSLEKHKTKLLARSGQSRKNHDSIRQEGALMSSVELDDDDLEDEDADLAIVVTEDETLESSSSR